ncbi:plasma protease C1 inhibitor-like [Stegostoma tigrinum]|uniref:plasma protease C1 inhibitor-like n=1 Tax=Stegostoma tigrinum TaxID=3053191 RepID=UPI0028702E00|nr:plasma protease C1 inhibitor-like [Stegostoma tigrinum]
MMITSLGLALLLQAACFLSLEAVNLPQIVVYFLPSRAERQHVRGLVGADDHCFPFVDPWQGCVEHKVPLQEMESVASSLTAFGLEAFHIIASYNQDSNVLISPVSLAAALTHLLLGARNDTKRDLEAALHYHHEVRCVHQALKEVLNRSPSLISASQLFYRDDIELKNTFRQHSERLYGVGPMPLSRNMSENVRDINSWISQHTGGKITEMVHDITADTKLMLLNAVFYKGTWKTKFRKEDTKEEIFSVSAEKKVTVPMLHQATYPLVAIFHPELNAKIAKFQLFGKSSLIVMVPADTSQTVLQFEQALTLRKLQAAIARLQQAELKPTSVLLPKLKLKFNQDLIHPFNDMGLQDVLVMPNLCGMSSNLLEISGAEHRAALTMDEDGVEAAAVTTLSVARSVLMFEVQQPFLFFLWHDDLGFPLFIGRVLDPSQ